MHPAMPIPIAPASETTASPISARSESSVFRGRPLSSSRACALIPTARKKAASVATKRSVWICVAAAAPKPTLARFQAVYGGWRIVTRSRQPPRRSA